MWLYGGYIVTCEGELFIWDSDNEFENDDLLVCTNCDYIGPAVEEHYPVIDEER